MAEPTYNDCLALGRAYLDADRKGEFPDPIDGTWLRADERDIAELGRRLFLGARELDSNAAIREDWMRSTELEPVIGGYDE